MLSFLYTSNESTIRLVDAVLERNIEDVQQALRAGARATADCGYGRNAIGLAAAIGDVELLRLLFQSCNDELRSAVEPLEYEMLPGIPEGMDELEWEDEFEVQPAAAAAEANNESGQEDEHTSLYYYYAKTLERTGEILSNITNQFYSRIIPKEEPHAPDKNQMTPLHYAAVVGHDDCVRFLLENGAPRDIFNADGFTPLHLSLSNNETFHTLISYGADSSIKCLNHGDTALNIAIRSHSYKSAIYLIMQPHENLNEVNNSDRTPLINAIRYDMDEIALLLLDRGAHLNIQDKRGRTALYYAVTRNKLDVTKRLLTLGARRFPEHFLLHYCVCLSLREMAALLVTHGDNLNIRNREGLTPIMSAIMCRNSNMLEDLLLMAATQVIGRRELYYLAGELLVAVEYINTLQDFEPISRLLFAYSNGEYWYAKGELSWPSCFEPLCASALAHAIMLDKMDIAEYLIKQGLNIEQICVEHNIRRIRDLASISEPGMLEFSKLLVYCGVQFPYEAPPYCPKWSDAMIAYETEMYTLCTNPLSLQILSRLVIRRALTARPFGDRTGLSRDLYSYHSSECILKCRIEELNLPKKLQDYILEYTDIPMKFKPRRPGPPRHS